MYMQVTIMILIKLCDIKIYSVQYDIFCSVFKSMQSVMNVCANNVITINLDKVFCMYNYKTVLL